MTTDNKPEEEDEEPLDHRFCHFCQDRVPEGIMLVINSISHEVISRTHYKICVLCGRSHDGQILASKDDDPNEKAVFQFEHFDYKGEGVDKLAKQLENMICHVCDEPVDREDSDMPARAFAIKMLRLAPDAVNVAVTCS